MRRIGMVLLLAAAAVLLAGCEPLSLKSNAPSPAPTSMPAAKGPDIPGDSRTVLFMDWTNVDKGYRQPVYDPNRLKDEARKEFESFKKGFNIDTRIGPHGMYPYHVPSGIRLAVEKARKSERWLLADQPWEKHIYGATVIHEQGKYRLWYPMAVAKQKRDSTWDKGRQVETTGGAMCYAESTDGMHWTKPPMGIIPFEGSTQNNMLTTLHLFTIFRDDHGPAEQRYKAFDFDKLPDDEVAKASGDMAKYGLYGAYSPDGYHWTKVFKPLVRHFCDTFNIAAWDPLVKKYVGYFRGHTLGRSITRGETTDFWNWPEPLTLMSTGPEEGVGNDYYSNCYTTYPDNPAIRLLFPAVYHRTTDHSDVRLAISTDGQDYNFVSHESILDFGKPGQWDQGQLYAQPNLVRLPDGTLALPYNGYWHSHNALFHNFYKDANTQSGLGWAIWDDGRLAGIQADDIGDFFCGRTETFDGKAILLNARADKGGKVEVELVLKDNPLPGFTFADCIPFKGNGIWMPLQWKGKADLSELAGKRFQLHFRATKAKVFGYKIVGIPKKETATMPTSKPSANPPKVAGGIKGFKGNSIEPTTQVSIPAIGGFKAVAPLGMVLGRPAQQPEGTKNIVSYEIGQCFQLDRTHALLVASMDEQGGPDLCVGNDAFVFEKLSDIKPEKAIPINRAEPNYKMPGSEDPVFLAKYPVTGFFVPLGATLPDGSAHPGAGTGVLMSCCLAFKGDRSDPTRAGKKGPEEENWDMFNEVIQVRWDGKKFTKTDVQPMPEVLGQTVVDKSFSQLIPLDKGFVGPFGLKGEKWAAIRFDWDGNAWTPTKIGQPFTKIPGECEATIQQDGGRYLITTRRHDTTGRMYVSQDGMDYKPLFDWPNIDTPRSLNKGLDGSLYLATNPSAGWFRNPLAAYPMIGDAFGEGVIIHDQANVRDDKGDRLPFIDHGLGVNIFLEGRWRHLIFFRVCDLKERTLYGFQEGVVKKIHGDTGPVPKLLSSGVYCAEMLYDKVTTPPWTFAEK